MRPYAKIFFFVFILIVFLFICFYSFKTLKTNYVMSDYFKQGRWEYLKNEYNKLQKKGYSSLFFGDSMTENFKKYLPESDSIVNMGISGDFTEGLIKRIDNVTHFKPENVFIMIGVNDIIEKVSLTEIEENYITIIKSIKTKCPKAKVYIQSTLPTYGLNSTLSSSNTINKTIQKLNLFLKQITKENNIIFIDMYGDFVNENNQLKPKLTTDGVHLNREGYAIWMSHIINYINTIN